MDISIRRAQGHELPAVIRFYDDVIDSLAGRSDTPKWKKGVYPLPEDMDRAIRAGEMMLGFLDGQLAGTMVVNQRKNDGYDKAPWQVQTDRFMIVHLLAVSPAMPRRGVGRAMIEGALDIARAQGMEAVRLDVVTDNRPAQRLYAGTGFAFIERVKLYYEDTGWCDFDLYEYAL